MSRNPWEEDTRPNLRAEQLTKRTPERSLLRESLQQRAADATPPEDDDSTLGMLMRQTVNNTTQIVASTAALNALRTDFDVLSREVRTSTRAAPISIQTSAKHASNRMAVLMGSLFTLYEVTSPWVREFFRQVMHR